MTPLDGHDRGADARRQAEQDADARIASDAEALVARADGRLSGADRRASDADQVASDADRDLADRDQAASDRDQATADREHSGPEHDPESDRDYLRSRRERGDAGRERDVTASVRAGVVAARLDRAELRDEIARLRDASADERDRAAIARDDEAAIRDGLAVGGAGDDAHATLAALRRQNAAIRDEARAERASSAANRAAAAADRERAAADRRDAGLDELTGVFRRGNGELALAHELARARRLGRALVIAMIDIDGLKVVNDAQGHAAGDALLRDVPRAIVATLRAYDVTVRWGGDEFVCALSDVDLATASQRITAIQGALDAMHPGASISVGLAELRTDDTLEAVIGRADAALYEVKSRPGS